MNSSKIVAGLLVGAAAGALAAILFAPDKGSTTRKKMVTKTGDLANTVKNTFNDFIDAAKTNFSGVKEEAEEVKDKAKTTLSAGKNKLKNAMS